MKSKSAPKPVPMTQKAASRIQSHEAKAGGGHVQAGSFTARAQRAAVLNQGAGKAS